MGWEETRLNQLSGKRPDTLLSLPLSVAYCPLVECGTPNHERTFLVRAGEEAEDLGDHCP
ncbi:hypothetical protein PQB86_gp268 [Klebsiella phage Miami]|uniref:Uncharacterized protein n=1 Tax=Klebsiella phage Miami TaxID=2767581 RepID=A0A873WGB9_9CAUD|nr:hypothetical protein PQB86_gp268 [Klebsiella phage Miami]QPB09363.1 hypothetical protein CPT_Miami_268 [Klebsiella phage Miami]